MPRSIRKSLPKATNLTTTRSKAIRKTASRQAKKTVKFTDPASYILRATMASKGLGFDEHEDTASSEPMWDAKQLAVGQHCSCISFLRVDAIHDNKVTVQSQRGGAWHMSRDLLERDCWSADHFEREVTCSMTELANVLSKCRGTVFTVGFRKQLSAKSIEQKLNDISDKELEDQETLKSLIQPESCELTGHLIEADNQLGRSVIVALNKPADNNVRQVDHRSIDYIIFRNVKYSLGRKCGFDLPLKANMTQPRWRSDKLQVGNWFSQVSYYRITEIVDDENVKVAIAASPQEVTLSKDILLSEMNNGCTYNEVVKVTRTEMVQKMLSANECAMSVTFCRKVDEAWAKKVLAEKARGLLDSKQAAKEMLAG